MNRVVEENERAGAPAKEWDTQLGAAELDPSLEGFATDISVNVGETIYFKVNAPALQPYQLEIYRLGYYGGLGARHLATVRPTNGPQAQPSPMVEPLSGLIDCGNWEVSAEWPVQDFVVSGIFVAKIVGADGRCGPNHIVFIVRDDASEGDILFQASDTTWHAYNPWGGRNFYVPASQRAYKVSYNRPFTTRFEDECGANVLFNAEYPMLRWIERCGFNVNYCAGVDTDRRADMLLRHRAFFSVGHDEYWSGAQRANVEAAREAGVHLAFFSGNEVYWRVRWEDSIGRAATSYRTLVCYKDSLENARIDPGPSWTGTWRDARFSPALGGGRPENALTGTLFGVQGFTGNTIRVTHDFAALRFWRETSIAALSPGDSKVMTAGLLGYEWNRDLDNGARPAGSARLSATTIETNDCLHDHGGTVGRGTATHCLTLYRHGSGALVFGAGTAQWAWGLDATHDTQGRVSGPEDADVQQATVNLLADMGVQPATLHAPLVPAAKSSDVEALKGAFNHVHRCGDPCPR